MSLDGGSIGGRGGREAPPDSLEAESVGNLTRRGPVEADAILKLLGVKLFSSVQVVW